MDETEEREDLLLQNEMEKFETGKEKLIVTGQEEIKKRKKQQEELLNEILAGSTPLNSEERELLLKDSREEDKKPLKQMKEPLKDKKKHKDANVVKHEKEEAIEASLAFRQLFPFLPKKHTKKTCNKNDEFLMCFYLLVADFSLVLFG